MIQPEDVRDRHAHQNDTARSPGWRSALRDPWLLATVCLWVLASLSVFALAGDTLPFQRGPEPLPVGREVVQGQLNLILALILIAVALLVTRRRPVINLAAGVPIVLGSDYAPATVSTPFQTLRAALMLQRDLAASDDALTLEQALKMATQAGPSLGRLGQLGQVAVGQLADLVLIDTTGLHHLGSDHPVPALALQARAGDVSTVIVDGRIVVEHGQLIDIDAVALASEARHALTTLASYT